MSQRSMIIDGVPLDVFFNYESAEHDTGVTDSYEILAVIPQKCVDIMDIISETTLDAIESQLRIQRDKILNKEIEP